MLVLLDIEYWWDQHRLHYHHHRGKHADHFGHGNGDRYTNKYSHGHGHGCNIFQHRGRGRRWLPRLVWHDGPRCFGSCLTPGGSTCSGAFIGMQYANFLTSPF